MANYSLNIKLPNSSYSVYFSKPALYLAIILLLLIVLPYPSPKPASAVGGDINIGANLIIGGGLGIKSTRYYDASNSLYFTEPAGTTILNNLSASGSANFLGNVGIGTAAPGAKLDVYGANVYLGGVTTGRFVEIGTTAGGYGMIQGQTNRGGAVAAQDLTLQPSGGNVGIGDATPSYPLDVTGEIRSTSNIYANDKIITSRYGHAGTYLSTEVQGIWSIGDAYQIDTTADDFGNLYGMGYAYSTNGGAPFTNQHQIVFTTAGTVTAAIGLTSGTGYFAGNVGIGTTAPAYKLDVEGSASIVGRFTTTATAGVGAELLLYQNSTSPAVNDNVGYIIFQGNPSAPATLTNYSFISSSISDPILNQEDGYLEFYNMNGGVTTRNALIGSAGIWASNFGTVVGTGTKALCWDNSAGSYIADCTGAPIADYAETYPTLENVDYGEIVATSLQTTTIKRAETDTKGNALPGIAQTTSVLGQSSEPYQNNIIGITSRNYGDFSSTGKGAVNESDHPLPVALSGRVPVKISPTSTSIKVGDPITSSDDPGKGIKAINAGRIVGTALENWDPNNPKDKILIFVNNSWHDPDLAINDSGDVTLAGNSVANYTVTTPTGITSKIGAFAEVVIGKIKAGLVETKQLIVDGVDIAKKLTELSNKVDSQQKQIDDLKKVIEKLKK
ncbi:MAG: FG-GAP repeat protein [Candidatus Collierbacteria bacterium GW2011_GWB2_45_17]|uniref:FG-GAP repeat protein n=1 Tax=Candidatus Collierbacteria bacterium GW2011_GWB2_45_17 TaxID=1618388 RepID=A0A837IHF7_9BACT|nr:MAG: FG-GAP repeat protein [Candidatus Collierbacteria bacterium GW2011_GWB2_45_17]